MKICAYKNKKVFVFIILIGLYYLWAFKTFFSGAAGWLDPSWLIGITWAKNMGVQWGNEILFTYGPLFPFAGAAVAELYPPNVYMLMQLGINLFYAVLKATLVFLFYRRAHTTYQMRVTILAGAAILLLRDISYPELIIFLSALLLCDYFCDLNASDATGENEKGFSFRNIFAVFLLSFAQFIKFSYFYVAFALIAIFLIIYICYKKYWIAAQFAGTYIVSSVALWLISGQKLAHLLGYFYTGFQFTSGYTSAMSKRFEADQFLNIFIFAVITISLFVVAMLYFAWKKNAFVFFSMLFISPQIFLLFKEAFVRADDHTHVFLRYAPLLALYLPFVFCMLPYNKGGNTERPLEKHKLIFAPRNALIAAIAVFVGYYTLGLSFIPYNQGLSIFNAYRNYKNYETIENVKHNIRGHYANFDEMCQHIGADETVDIFPWDISLLYSYGLNWQPRPVIQSYTNYTATLDQLTAGHFLEAKAPDKLIYDLQSIDNRYSIFDEPETFRTVLCNYSSIASNDTYLVLEKSRQPSTARTAEIYSTNVRNGEMIEVPLREDEYVFMEVDWDYNLFGKFMNFFFKATQPYVTIQLADGVEAKYRFIHKTAENGIFVSKMVRNVEELNQVFNKKFSPDITGVRIAGNGLFYKKDITVKFYSIPF